MSNCTVIQTNQELFIGADSATSVTVGGTLYRQDELAKKLFHIDDKIIFCSGDLHFCYGVMEQFQLLKTRDIKDLRDLCIQRHKGEVIEILIAEYDGIQSVVSQMASYSNFDLVRHSNLPSGAVNILTGGIKVKESYEIAYESLLRRNTIREVYQKVFDEIAFEGVGGTLTVYRINRHGIQLYFIVPIKKPRNLKVLSLEILSGYLQTHMIVGERIYGKVLMGTNLAIEDEHGIVKWQGSLGEIFDRNGKLVMKMGLVEENPDSFGLWSFNDITRVRMDDRVGIAIERKNSNAIKYPNGWEKIFWADQRDGTLYTHDLIAENIKIVNNVGDIILDAENNYLDIGSFENIVMDNKFTTLEKMQIITELYKIEAGYKRMLEQAAKYKTSQRDDTLNTNTQFLTKTPSTIDLHSTTPIINAYSALLTYMEQYIRIVAKDPLNISVNDPLTETTSNIPDRAEFILKFKNYYDAEKDLRNKIEDSQFYSGLNMGQFYNNVVIGEYGFIALRNDGKYRAWLSATNGLALQKWENNKWTNKVYASIGNSTYEDGTLIAEDLVAKRLRIETKDGGVLLDVNSLTIDFSVLNSIILDNVIMSPEKIILANQFKSVTKQYNELKSAINKYATTIYNERDSTYTGLVQAKINLDAANTELTNSYNALNTYMTPVFVDMNAKTHIIDNLHSTRLEFHQKWEDFYKAFENGRSKLADFLEKSSLQLGRNYNNTVIDAVNGVVVTRGNKMNKTTLNATDGIKIEQNVGNPDSPIWVKRFYVDLNGFLFAEELRTKALKILDAKLGEAILFDALNGITINGQHGEQIRLNANEGIAIDVNSEKRFWIHTDGTLRAKRFIVSDDDTDPLQLLDGSYVSKLAVNELRTMNSNNPQDYIHIKDTRFQFLTGTGTTNDLEKLSINLEGSGSDSTAVIKMGIGDLSANQVGFIRKDHEAFKLDYTATLGYLRKIWLTNNYGTGTDGIVIESQGAGINVKTNHKIRLEVDGNNYIEISSTGVKIAGSRIDLN